ncbi:MAG TPA: hypothetical protein VG817_00140 [Gemmatimonadales bacterium]|nr:hypothetical protein [Gemmatimonadales bacterium]
MLLAEQVRSAASPEGMIVLAIIYAIFWVLSKAGGKKPPAGRPLPPPSGTLDPSQEEGFSLEKILRQIEEAKRQAEEREREVARPRPRPEPAAARLRPSRDATRGPMGRRSQSTLPGAEEVEERDSLEGSTLEIEERAANFDNRIRKRVDQDEEAEAVVQRRIAAAQARNREHRKADHQAFDQRIREPAPEQKAERRFSPASMRDAVVWREILGPPKALE